MHVAFLWLVRVVLRHDLQRYLMIEHQRSRLLVRMTRCNHLRSQRGEATRCCHHLVVGALYLWEIFRCRARVFAIRVSRMRCALLCGINLG